MKEVVAILGSRTGTSSLMKELNDSGFDEIDDSRDGRPGQIVQGRRLDLERRRRTVGITTSHKPDH